MGKDEEKRPNVLYARIYNTNKIDGNLYVHPKEYRRRIPKELSGMCPSQGDVVHLDEGGNIALVMRVEHIDLKEVGEDIPPIRSVSQKHTNNIKNYKIVMLEDREKKDVQKKVQNKVETIKVPSEILKRAKINIDDKLFFEVDGDNRIIIEKAPALKKEQKDYKDILDKVSHVDLEEPMEKGGEKHTSYTKKVPNQQRTSMREDTEKRDIQQEPQEFNDRLRSLLAEQKMTQSELAEQIGMTGASISQYATGKRVPSVNVLRKIAEVMNVSPQWLAGNR